ncbi:MAG: ABC transporter ATP-binding protein [Planctomycetes bacterium]|nr:ABC transporter ATP-binding protein [Planctomycetota bacterium]
MTDAVLLDGLSKSFGDRRVLDGIDLRVAPGEVLGYLGPNGAGKSTTVRILVGMLAGFEGRAEVAGFDVREHPLEVKRRIGYVAENAVLYEALTVQEHLLLVGRLHGLRDEAILARAKPMLDAFDLGSRIASRLGALSKGMRQKVMIVGALLHDPEVLFLDEPLSGLDAHSAVLIKELIRALADDGRTIFYCSHMLDVVERVCDRLVILADGRIAANGTLAELRARSQGGGTLERIFLELTSDGGASQRARAVVAALGHSA